jgi:hypothetical protein
LAAGGQFHRDLPVGEAVVHLPHHDVDDAGERFPPQRAEQDDLVEPVQELGAEDVAKLLHDPGADLRLLPSRHLLDPLGPDVGGEDHTEF